MSSTPPSGGIVLVEPLEARIAPALVYVLAGDPNSASDAHYITFTNTPTANSLHFVPASQYGVNVPNVFALQLTGDGSVNPDTNVSNGAEIVVFNSVTGFNLNVPLVQANKGTVVAFFLDRNALPGGDPALAGQVFADELVGIALGKKASVTINGNVHGDIVTNLLNGGQTLSLTSDGARSQGINGIQMIGNVEGNILAGGNIKNVNITGSVENILAGTASNGLPFNFSGGTADATGTITNTATPGLVGPNINNLVVSMIDTNGRIQAGDGGLTATGGAITNVVIQADTSSFHVLSGSGGDGTASLLGGTGGAIDNVRIVGTTGAHVNAPILIEAGHGGNNPVAHGGTGGAVDGVSVGFDNFDNATNTGTISADLLNQNVTVVGGDGGSGIKGGNGGAVSNSAVVGLIADDGVTGADGVANAEIQVFGGAGGVGTAVGRGKGGHGGSIAQLMVENLNVSATGLFSSILVQGGAGGAAKGGGNVSNVTLLGTNLTVNGGDGGNGINKGGSGGSLDTIEIDNLTNLYTRVLILDGGIGGASSNGFGGAGGNVGDVLLTDADIAALAINLGTHGNGGLGARGAGGAGGAVTNVTLNNSAPTGGIGAIAVRSGQGGDGTTSGGDGGTVDTLTVLGQGFSFSVAGGAGGNLGVGVGNGGAGGSLINVGITNAPPTPTALDDPTALSGTVSGGAGGVGLGFGGLGGKGGDLTSVNLRTVYNVSMTAGNAGNGESGAHAGGTINGAAATSLQGGVNVTAGSGGQTSGSASDGGSINGLLVNGQGTLSIIAGSGGSGGAGGSITNSGSTTNELTGLPNIGNLAVTAGNGSSLNGVAGAGGSISTFNGYVADGFVTLDGVSHPGATAITAGAGGGGNTSTASGKGGSIDTVTLTGSSGASEAGGFVTSQLVVVDGGAAGPAGEAARGRTGGSVSNINIYNLDPGTVVQHIAAGDGANGLRKGGAGGNISDVHVGLPGDPVGDIGYRSGVAYGYALGQAGGVFAGIGGLGGNHNGPNGNVTDVTANAISSIVAGKGTPQLCTKVDGIFLDGLTVPTTNTTDPTLVGSFTNFDTANIAGSIVAPTSPGASTFKQGDGLVAAANLTINRNFVPEALLTLDAVGNLVLVDFQEPNVTPVVEPVPSFLS